MTGQKELLLRDEIYRVLKPFFEDVKISPEHCGQANTDAAVEVTRMVLLPFLKKEKAAEKLSAKTAEGNAGN